MTTESFKENLLMAAIALGSFLGFALANAEGKSHGLEGGLAVPCSMIFEEGAVGLSASHVRDEASAQCLSSQHKRAN